jgi:UDP-glucose 4-epimerase
MNILVTGGAGYIGSHACLRLLELRHAVTIIDDLSRGNRAVIDILAPRGDLAFVHGDVGDSELTARALREREIEVVMHFAALCYVGESVHEPLRYFRANVAGTIGLLEAMEMAGTSRLVFSSSCATYGEPAAAIIPIAESCPQQPVNPYGWTKLASERVIADVAAAHRARGQSFAFALLRYFNVAGCDPQGRLGEDHDPETHLIPICLDAALGRRGPVTIFGTNYDTPDGTCIRDYVHVTDLVEAHVSAMTALERQPSASLAWNVGLGHGSSVREVLEACRRVSGTAIDTVEGPRRAGDPPRLFADPAKIRRELGWSARFTSLDDIVRTAWAWRQAHPRGFQS